MEEKETVPINKEETERTNISDEKGEIVPSEIIDNENLESNQLSYNVLKEYIKNCCGLSIKTNQHKASIKTIENYSYQELKENRHEYLIQFKEIPGKESEDLKEYSVKNDTGFFSKYIFTGPAKGFKFSLYQRGEDGQGINTGITFEKENDNPFAFKNSKSIIVKENKNIFGEIKVDNGWIYDTYSIYPKNENGAYKFAVRINKYTWEYNFRNTILCNFRGLEFPIINIDGIIVGKIRKENPSNPVLLCKGWSKINYFSVDYPGDASEEEKIMLLGLAIALDDIHIEDTKEFN